MIKVKIFFAGIAILGMTLSFSSCKKAYFYDGINDDPTQLKEPQPALLLPPILLSSGYIAGGDESRFPSIFMQHVTGAANQSFSASIYNVSPDDVDNMWSFGFYGGLMNNTYDLINIAGKLNQRSYHAIGQIVMANLLQRTTDLWGDIPYFGSFKGNDSKNAPFDTQEAIYTEVFRLLNNGIAEIAAGDDGATIPGAGDYVYGGDMDNWSYFAHALKARSFLHLVKRNPIYYDSVLKEIPLAFPNASVDAMIPFSATSVNSTNPTYQFNDQRGDITYNGKLQDMLVAANDPRFNVYFDADDDEALGELYGSENSSVPLMTYDELKFIEAEAQFQKGNLTAAANAYNAAVRANLIRTVGNDDYLSSVSKTAATISLTHIMTQKYIAMFLRSESWTDWRRTGLPVLTAASGNVTGGTIPRALLYPSKEIRYNSNTPTNRTLTSRLWWDQ
jgi:hypothetical protein